MLMVCKDRMAEMPCFPLFLCYGRHYTGSPCASTACCSWHHDGQPDRGFIVTETSDWQTLEASLWKDPLAQMDGNIWHLDPAHLQLWVCATGLNPSLDHCDPAVLHTICNAGLLPHNGSMIPIESCFPQGVRFIGSFL